MDKTRFQTRKKILDVLITNNRENKNQYCENHAMEKATLIETTLFDKCYEINQKNHMDLYNNVDIQLLVNNIELKTNRCIC
jgi:hypothetical protein